MPRKKKQEMQEQLAPLHQKNNPNVMGLHADTVEQAITDTLETNYMPYAMSVIVSRAIPEIDGFKPSHRKLLYTMYKMGLLNGGRTKSANIVGQTMRLNPHGDAAIYDTMVRLSKGYSALLHPFVDSKGNFGKVYSRDMAWAASRYTEAKLSDISSELFRDIDYDAVDFVDNYDNTMKEPALLPAAFPNVLVSANTGIAVGMASQLCGFNLKEVCDTTIAYLQDENCDITKTLLAPDFPTGGEVIYDKKAISGVYETGRGGIKVKSRWRYDKKGNLIEIYEIPYSTTTEAIMDKVEELVKTNKLREISDMRDETDLSGLKLTIDLKRGTDPEALMNKLFKTTPLMDTFSCNFNVLVNGLPRVMGIREILKEWCAWRNTCIVRKIAFTLSKKQKKLHLLEGLAKILLDIDKAIKIIRETENDADVVPNLMAAFALDDVQAEYVAEIKLRNINKEYILKRTQEINALKKEIASLEKDYSSKSRQKKIMIRELEQVRDKYGVDRATGICYDAPAAEETESENIPEYPVSVFVTQAGYLKKITPASLKMNNQQKLKEGDIIVKEQEANNSNELLVFTDKQQAYKTRLSDFEDMKASVLGDYLQSSLEMNENENVLDVIILSDYSGFFLFCYENGKIAKIPVESYKTINKRKRLQNAYCDKSALRSVLYLKEDADIVVYSSDNRVVTLNSSYINPKPTRSSQGVNILTTKKGRVLSKVELLDGSSLEKDKQYRPRSFPSIGKPL